MKLSYSMIAAAASAVLLAGAGHAATVALAPDGHWDIQDDNMSVGDFFTNDYQATANETVDFTDLYVASDQFGVYLNGVFQFNTPSVPDWAAQGAASSHASPPYTTDPNVAWASGNFSTGMLHVHAGDIISFTDIHIPPQDNGQVFPDGTIAVQAVPEPATWAMLILGVGLVGFAMRRRQGFAAA